MKAHILFWAICAILMLGISVVVFRNGHYTRNYSFTLWVCFVTISQLVALWGLLAGVPPWITATWRWIDWLALSLLVLASVEGLFRYETITNRPVLMSLCVMAGLQLTLRYFHGLPAHIEIWAHNLSFFAPAMWLFIELSGVQIERLPLWLRAISKARFEISEALRWTKVMLP